MKKIQFFICALLFSFATAVQTTAQTNRYVAPTGSDTGNDCTNPANPCKYIQHAQNEASPGDIIILAAGEYTQAQSGGLLIVKDIDIQGASAATTFVQADTQANQASHRVITISPQSLLVEISDLTIRYGVAAGSGEPGRGGGIYNPDGTGQLTLTNVTFTENTARVGGGLLNINGGNVMLQNVAFNLNEASERGGGIYNAAGTAMDLSSVDLMVNEAGISGGGIYNESGVSPSLNDVLFQGNTAVGSNCGGMCLQDTTMPVSITNTDFIGNVAGKNGGGLYLINSSPGLISVVFDTNSASGNGTNVTIGGGGMYINGGAPSLEDVVFTDNVAFVGGGILNSNGASPSLKNVSFLGNDAGAYGGGMRNVDSSPILINVLFEGNIALNNGLGGGMQNSNSSPTLKNATFKDNFAVGGYGGAVHNQGGFPIFTNVSFTGNQATQSGGGMYNLNNSLALLVNVSFSGNQATQSDGGAIYNTSNSSVSVSNSVFWGNTAGGTGNEIFNDVDGSASMQYSLYSNGAGDIEMGNAFACNNCLTIDPLFVNPGIGDLQLTATSPAIDAGDPATSVGFFPTDGNGNAVDILGNPRFFGGTIDMGAYEWNNLAVSETEKGTKGFVFYPNPAKDFFIIDLGQSPKKDIEVSVSNLLGQSVFSAKMQGPKMQVAAKGWASGMYFVNITDENGTRTTKKLLIE